ncbi:hypothetical protein [Capnocytophaga stomatis]|uniref:Septum formation initiator n=1 Tax=Capnocytophaga stomatis TaxID=1848904 RepID=A0ABW8QDM4_9FLAO|nr:hypothetical protein [Capnocytophaga stomatis]GIJ95066.1 hypothetical protein CAPN002_22840 [Capnocytophaga stomatis]
MIRKNSKFSFQKIFEEHPIKACIGCLIFGAVFSYKILSFLYDSKIQNIKDRYEDKIETIKAVHKQELQINEIKLRRQDGVKYYLNIEPNSELANDINKLLESNKNGIK